MTNPEQDVSSSSGDALVALGYYYMTGEDDPEEQNTTKAIEYFKRAADLGVTTGLYHWSLMQLGTSPYVPEGKAADALRDNANCSLGLEGIREVALRGRWIADALPWSTELAYSSFVHGKTDRALVHYMLSAELGSPTSQVNAAFLLRKGFGTGFDSPSLSRRVSLLMQDHAISGQTSVGWGGLELPFSRELLDRIDPWRTTNDLRQCEDDDVGGAGGTSDASPDAGFLPPPPGARFANQDRHLAMVAAKRLATLSDRQNVGEGSRMLADCKLAPEEWDGVCAPDEEGAYELFERGSGLGDSESTFKLGMSYLSGERRNVTKGREYLLLCNDMDPLAGWPCILAWYFSWILLPENAVFSWPIRFLFGGM